MAGNVWEWTRSLFEHYPYDAGDGREDVEAVGARVVRGGSFYFLRDLARCAFRDWYYDYNVSGNGGFRVCVSPSRSAL
jgi:formylglycine-generating enzyme required for sulfatase activity